MTNADLRIVPFELTMQHERDKHAHFADKTRISDWRDLEGKIIRSVVQDPCGPDGSCARVVLVTDDGMWAPLSIDGNDDDARICIDDWYTRKLSAADIMSPLELWGSGMVNEAQRDYLTQKAADQKRAEAKSRAEALRKQAQKLEDEAT